MKVPLVLFAALASGAALAELRIENYRSGDTVRTPVVLVRGTGAGRDVTVAVDGRKATKIRTDRGAFIAPVELRAGRNTVQVGNQSLELEYRMPTSPYRVVPNLVLPTGFSESEAGKLEKRLWTGLEVVQALVAQAVRDTPGAQRDSEGSTRLVADVFTAKTFPLFLDTEGLATGNLQTQQKSPRELATMDVAELAGESMDQEGESTGHQKQLYVLLSDRDDLTNRLGADTIFVAAPNLRLWPVEVSDVPAAMRGPNKGKIVDDWSRTVQAILEALGLPNSYDPSCLMAGRSGELNRLLSTYEPRAQDGKRYTIDPQAGFASWGPHFSAPIAAVVNWYSWFQPDAPEVGGDARAPMVEYERQSERFRVTAPDGLRVLGFVARGQRGSVLDMSRGRWDADRGEYVVESLVEVPRSGIFTGDEGPGYVLAVDSEGRLTVFEDPLLP